MSDRMKPIREAIVQIERVFGAGAVIRLGDDDVKLPVGAVSSGSIGLDRALGVGGYAKGRISEIFGPEGSGKTTLLLHLIANAQAEGGLCAFIDAEHALDVTYAESVGVRTDDLLISQPDYGEQGLEIADMLIRSGGVAVLAVDSVAALTPKAEIEGQMGDASVGMQSRMMSQAMRKLAGIVSKTETILVFTNQLREKVGVVYGPTETQPGGRALKFYSSQRLDIRRIETLKSDGEAVGNRVRVKVVKNKVAAPHRQAEFDIDYGRGISVAGELLDLGLEHGLVEKKGNWFDFGDPLKANGRDAAKCLLRNDAELRAGLDAQVRAALGMAKPALAEVG